MKDITKARVQKNKTTADYNFSLQITIMEIMEQGINNKKLN